MFNWIIYHVSLLFFGAFPAFPEAEGTTTGSDGDAGSGMCPDG